MKDPRFKTTFASIPGSLRTIEPTEETRNEVKASLSRLRELLPADIDPVKEEALLFVAGNLAVAGFVNLNDDGYDIPTALATYKLFERQQINIEHERKNVVGYIVHAGLSELGTDRVLTEDEARASGKPFNVAVVIALWRVVNRDLCAYIEEAASPTHPDFNSLSLSFEVGFENYRIVALPGGDPDISTARVTVKPDESAFGQYDGALRCNGGNGLDPSDANLRIYRVIDDQVLPLGGGIVTVPAAAVKGLTTISQKPEPVVEDANATAEQQAEAQRAQDIALALEQAKNLQTERICAINAFLVLMQEKVIPFLNLPKTRVSRATPNDSYMKLSDLKAIQASLATLAKTAKIDGLTEVAASFDPVLDAIVKESEKMEADRIAAESHTAAIAKARDEAAAASLKLTEDLAAVRKELDTIKAAQASAAAEEAFQGRMVAIDTEFDLTEEERGLIVSDIKSLDDAAFAAFLDKQKKLMKEKTKDFKKKKADDAKAAQSVTVAALLEKGIKAKITDEGLVVEEILASAKGNEVSAPAGSIVQPNENDINALAKKAFPNGIQIAAPKKK